jgi:branched-subunit amino acid transport protein AzlD
MLSVREALILTLAMGAVILFCRAFPFFFFRNPEKRSSPMEAFLSFVEKVTPPVAMTVLAFNAISAPLKENFFRGLPALAASAFTALVHLWKRNVLVSILGGVLAYMALRRVLGWGGE